ncbi:MAG: hypothetical protein KC613_20490, partial [Myxococcales bacterium]|nr:hypothetical protein [Myxococcales bacterium]
MAATPSAPAEAQPYRPPAVTRALSAAHTQVVVGVEGLDWLFRNVARVQAQVLPALPPEVVADLPPQAKDPKFLPAFLDFAPETPAGWQGVGVQPGAGLSLVLDDRLFIDGKPIPLLAAQITEQGRFLAWLNTLEGRHGPKKGVTLTGETQGACQILRLSEAEACLGVRRGLTLVLPLPKADQAETRAALAKAFTAIVEDAGPALADKADFQAALRRYPGTPAAFAWVDHKLSGALWARERGADGALPPDAAFFLDRFPASTLWYGSRGAGLLIRADQAGAAALARMLRPADGPPDLTALVGPRTAFYRLALNLPTLFEGVADLVPPSRGQVKGQILLAKNMLPVATGVAWEDLTGGLTGHAAFLIDIPAKLPPDQPDPHGMLAVLGVKDAAKAQRALDAGLKKALEANPKLAGPTVTVAGREVPSLSPLQIVALIDGPRLLVGTRVAVERALAAKHTPPATVRETLEDATFLAFGLPFEAVWSALELPPEVKANAEAGRVFWDRILTDGYMAGGLRVDEDGLSSAGGGAVLMPGILAAIAI